MIVDEMKFIYQSASGKISFYEILKPSESELYIQGVCINAHAIRTFRKDRILEKIDEATDVDARLKFFQENWIGTVSTNVVTPKIPRNYSSGKLEICFTGFKQVDKDRLTQAVEAVDFIVRTSVTSRLHFLCCGYNAGPSKIEKARFQGTVILNEKQLLNLLETGEIPESETF
jgi:NAD-dependent DNA ligase